MSSSVMLVRCRCMDEILNTSVIQPVDRRDTSRAAQRAPRCCDARYEPKGDKQWKTKKFGQPWIGTGQPPRLVTLKRNTRSITTTSWSSILSRASESAVVTTFRPFADTTRRILGSGDLWITEYVLSYNEQPTQTVSIMEFRDGKVARETQYFADPFEPPAWRTQWVEHPEK